MRVAEPGPTVTEPVPTVELRIGAPASSDLVSVASHADKLGAVGQAVHDVLGVATKYKQT